MDYSIDFALGLGISFSLRQHCDTSHMAEIDPLAMEVPHVGLFLRFIVTVELVSLVCWSTQEHVIGLRTYVPTSNLPRGKSPQEASRGVTLYLFGMPPPPMMARKLVKSEEKSECSRILMAP